MTTNTRKQYFSVTKRSTESESKQALKRLWAAVVTLAVQDYRRAVMEGDLDAQRTIEYELDVMGYGSFIRRLMRSALDFRSLVTVEARHIEDGKTEYFDCPGCKAVGAVSIRKGKKAVTGTCLSCGLRFRKENA